MEQAFKTLEEEIEVWSEKLLARLPLSETSGYRKEGKLDRSLFPHRELSLVATQEQDSHRVSGGSLCFLGERGCKQFLDKAQARRYVIVLGASHMDLISQLTEAGREAIMSGSKGKAPSPPVDFSGTKVLLKWRQYCQASKRSGRIAEVNSHGPGESCSHSQGPL